MFESPTHDHGHCIDTALAQAERLCLNRGARLTDLRRQVLELIWRRHEPVGAYDLLEELRTNHRRAAPPTIYRALDFLIEQGLVHRIESLNAYVGCPHPDQTHVGQFLICTGCGSIGEMDDGVLAQMITEHAAKLGFRVERQTVEVRGRCGTCQAAPAVA